MFKMLKKKKKVYKEEKELQVPPGWMKVLAAV